MSETSATEAPYGTWTSPITPHLLVQGAAGLSGLHASGGWLWWLEARPEEAGRVQLVRRALGDDGMPVGDAVDVLPEGFSARNRVHEYGGGSLWVHGTTALVTSWDDQRIWRVDLDAAPVPITPEPQVRHALRYADGDVSPDGEWIACVREEHGRAGTSEAVNEIVAVRTDGAGEPVVLVSGPDFVARPRWSPDGRHLAWIEWSHPDLPWDATELLVAEVVLVDGDDGPDPELAPEALDDGEPDPDLASLTPVLVGGHVVAGGGGEAVAEVCWDPEDRLWFVSDRSGWWNPWRLDDLDDDEAVPTQVVAIEAELTLPHWIFGTSRLAFPGGGVAVVAQHHGVDHLCWSADRGDVELVEVDAPWTALEGLVAVGDRIAAIGATFTSESEVLLIERIGDRGVEATAVRRARDLGIDAGWLPQPEHVTVPVGDGEVAHALVFPPTSPEVRAPSDERPPLVVMIHGGPTSAARSLLQLNVAFWTSRGFAVADVNYRGSVGYGRAYRHSLDGCWGLSDVEDCVAVARWLAAEGRVDGERLAIRGGSAGGFTTLCALTFHDEFAVGCSSYGVVDLAALAADTHKFESRYLDRLVGPWPEARATYEARSPIHHTDRLATPLLVLQGEQDEIVPPNQAELLVAALRDRGIPHAYLLFPSEQHGFRQASTIIRALEAELLFVSGVLGFVPAGDMEPLAIVGQMGDQR